LSGGAAEQQFRQFAAQYGKSYASEEFGERLRIFRVPTPFLSPAKMSKKQN
jgi:hypothetical protein